MHADQLTPLIALAKRKGITDLIPIPFTHEHGWWIVQDSECCMGIPDDAAALIVTGSLSKWLAGQGIAVAKDTDGQWISMGTESITLCQELPATDFLSALISAATARLEEMQDKEKANDQG